jgi:hypothetical protein
MERQRFSFGMQFGLIFRYFLRHAALVLLMALLLAGALYPLILIFRSQMDLARKILSAVLELIFSGIILCTAYSKILEGFRSYPNFRIHVAKTTRNQNWLREFVEKETDENVRNAAVARISDPNELIAIALQDASHVIRRTAASHVQNSKNAEELIARSKDDSVRAEAVRWIKNESVLLELACNDSSYRTRVNAARNINSAENQLTLLCVTKDSEVWKSCLPQLMKQTIQNGKLAVEIVTKLKAAPLGDDWLKKTVCPHCYFSEYRVDERAGESELVYWASDNVVYENHTTTYFVCESCGQEETSLFFVPLSSFFPDEAK